MAVPRRSRHPRNASAGNGGPARSPPRARWRRRRDRVHTSRSSADVHPGRPGCRTDRAPLRRGAANGDREALSLSPWPGLQLSAAVNGSDTCGPRSGGNCSLEDRAPRTRQCAVHRAKAAPSCSVGGSHRAGLRGVVLCLECHKGAACWRSSANSCRRPVHARTLRSVVTHASSVPETGPVLAEASPAVALVACYLPKMSDRTRLVKGASTATTHASQ